MQQWYTKTLTALLSTKYYQPVNELLTAAEKGDHDFLFRVSTCITDFIRINERAPTVVIIGTGRLARAAANDLSFRDTLKRRVYTLSFSSPHATFFKNLGYELTSDLTQLLTSDFILMCVSSVDSQTLEEYIAQNNIQDRVLRP